MKALKLILPALALGGAAVLVLPGSESYGFSTIGGSLGVNQRDVRLFNNFADTASNNNTAISSQYPGYDGAELAMWKAVVEWGSLPFGDGTGDPTQPNLGDGGANFDGFWAGNASAVGNQDQNIVSAIDSCGGGTLAFTETPISNGWRIRFCDNHTWADGPGTVGNSQFDIQSVMAHEYGHALGLGHTFNGPTMQPAVSPGNEALRSIEADDIAGVQFIYGVMNLDKPRILATLPNGDGTITIYGANFDPAGNQVWFTNANSTSAGTDARVIVSSVTSTFSGSRITVTIPNDAGPGNVIVQRNGSDHSDLSNAFPTDLVNQFGDIPPPPMTITNVTPSQIPALIPGTAQTVTITGTGLTSVTEMMYFSPPFAVPIDASRFTIVNDTTITLDPPQAIQLGPVPLTVSNGLDFVSTTVDFVEVATPQLEVGSGEPFNIVDVTDGLNIIAAGAVGQSVMMFASTSDLPSVIPSVALDLGNNFSQLIFLGTLAIEPRGYTELFFDSTILPSPPGGGLVFFAQGIQLTLPIPVPVTNLQSVTFVP